MKKILSIILMLIFLTSLSGCVSASRKQARAEKRARKIQAQEQRKAEEERIRIEESKPENRRIGFSCISCKRRWILRAYEIKKECPVAENCNVKCPFCGKKQDAEMASKRFEYDNLKEMNDRAERMMMHDQPNIVIDNRHN